MGRAGHSSIVRNEPLPRIAGTVDLTRDASGGPAAGRDGGRPQAARSRSADLMFREGRFDELRALLSQWKGGDDACLRAEAARRESMLTHTR